ncbi:YdcF family protein [Rubrobacter aplysinae]|uniref:YdcF family protein n=1 Tax=Rubrobacter aplysinae TaxID=909625 RepID=UPI00069F244F|nr:YdcF family protein [Rubrobacter aplysinae]
MGKETGKGSTGGRIVGAGRDLLLLLRVYRGGLTALLRSRLPGCRTLTVVLGAQVRPGGVPSRTLASRARHAGRMYARGELDEEGWIVVSGGLGDHPPSEAEVMAGILAGEGVPEGRIIREAASHSTRQSAHHVAVIARRLAVEEVVLVTDPLHCVRAAAAFRAEGLRPRPEPVTGSPMWRQPAKRRAQLVREAGAAIWYRLWRPSG